MSERQHWAWAMERKLRSGKAIDVSDCPREGRYYVLDATQAGIAEAGGIDFCDARTEAWIWSIGRRHADGVVLASTGGDLYQNPAFKCIWLR